MFFDRYEDARMRLQGTIILYKGKSAKVDEVQPDLKLNLSRLRDGDRFILDQREEGVELKAPPVGYVNMPHGACYLVRRPVRAWKQGLATSALYAVGVGRELARVAIDRRFLYRTLDGEFPSLKKVLDQFESGTNPFKQEEEDRRVAFDRAWAIEKDGTLYHKGRRVGLRKKDWHFDLKDDYQWLIESLEVTLNENR